MSELERYNPGSNLPSASEWQTMNQVAVAIADSGIVPRSYQGKVANVLVATLTGRPFGWDPLTAMRNIHVIEGTASIKPEALLGMIRAGGHSLSIKRGETGVTVSAKRRDTGDTMEVTYTFQDAARAGLCSLDKDGRPVAKSSTGGVKPWQAYPLDMCQWRAVAAVARGLFSDLTLGFSYTPEELGATVTIDGEVVPSEDNAPVSERTKTSVAKVVSKLATEDQLAEVERLAGVLGLTAEQVVKGCQAAYPNSGITAVGHLLGTQAEEVIERMTKRAAAKRTEEAAAPAPAPDPADSSAAGETTDETTGEVTTSTTTNEGDDVWDAEVVS